ncbi:MAG: DUF485 domain-containing protein [Candidatus Nomurabacteria bacterium]|jgi:uncharacterized membrane protein (DUF485 family)|nr:DUF485 domain-containing protein [Candidatus Nomurabacteria bacterium]
MEKAIIYHRKYVEKRYRELLKARLAKTNREATERAIRDLSEYQTGAIANFQAERSVHLRVTLFFSSLMILLFVGTGVLLANFPPDWQMAADGTALPADLIFFGLIFLLDLIVFVLTGAYIRHYYKLENRVQSLYGLSKKIYELTLPIK